MRFVKSGQWSMFAGMTGKSEVGNHLYWTLDTHCWGGQCQQTTQTRHSWRFKVRWCHSSLHNQHLFWLTAAQHYLAMEMQVYSLTNHCETVICTSKTKLQTLQSCVFSSDNRETNQQNIFPPEFEISQFLGWIKSPNVLLVKSYFLVVGLSMHHHQSQLPLTRVIAIETLLIVFSSRHLFTIMVPVRG